MALGFLMTGGASSRMRRPKALLPWYDEGLPGQNDRVQFLEGGRPLARHLGDLLQTVCREVYLVGDAPVEIAGIPQLSDAIPGAGPLGGILRALELPGDCWRLVLSCDTPFVTSGFLGELLALAETETATGRQAVIPRTPDGQLHPLCGVYHGAAGTLLREMLTQSLTNDADVAGGVNARKRAPSMHSFVRRLAVRELAVPYSDILRNLNTMQEYLAAIQGRA